MNAIRRRILLLLVFSIIFFLFTFYNAFGTSSKPSIPNEVYQKSKNKTEITRKKREPIILSKSEYYNQTRNVISFLFSIIDFF